MKDEIKEILDVEKYRNKDGYVENISLLPSEIHKLLDCITNLQEELKETADLCSKHFVKIQTLKTNMKELQQENEKLKEENKRIFSKVNDDELLISNAMNYAEAQNYKSRCEKASEYIKENPARCWYDAKKKSEKFGDIEIINHQKILLDILQGSDK